MQKKMLLHIKGSRAAKTTKDRVQLATHKRSHPDEDFDDVGVDVPDVVVEPEDRVDVLFPWVVAAVVLALVGAEESTARLARKTFKALNSCPRPVFPSYLFFVQLAPQAVLLSPPEHCFAAPSADL